MDEKKHIKLSLATTICIVIILLLVVSLIITVYYYNSINKEEKHIPITSENFKNYIGQHQFNVYNALNYLDDSTFKEGVKVGYFTEKNDNKDFKVNFTLDKVIETAGPNGNLYNTMMGFILEDEANKNHPILQDYLPGGKRSDMPVINFYWDYCSSGKPYYVHVPHHTMKDMIQRIHEDGGIAILAHPWKNFYQREDLLFEAMSYGLDGIEAYSNYHNEEQNAYYEAFCKKHNLIMTCGSDYHGFMKPQIQMGEFGYKKDELQEILDTFLKAIKK